VPAATLAARAASVALAQSYHIALANGRVIEPESNLGATRKDGQLPTGLAPGRGLRR
jgi:hypothetical protein